MTRTKTWIDRVWHEFRAGSLTPLYRDVLLRLHEYCGCGEVWPSHETLAERARCSVRTVQRALAAARELGLLQWFERRVHSGWRWLRTSNRYILLGGATTGQDVRGNPRKEKQERIEVVPAGLAAPLLAARRAAFRLGKLCQAR